MLRTGSVVALAALVVGLSGCGGGPPKAASESASRLLAAAVADDRVAFEAEIDRRAIREDLRRQVTEMARGASLDVEGGPSDLVLDRMIGPAALTLVRAGTGEALTAPPTPRQVGRLMKVLEGKQVCLTDAAANCVLTFAKSKDGWRLVAMRAMDLKIEVAEASD
jgi:hypothetical protein